MYNAKYIVKFPVLSFQHLYVFDSFVRPKDTKLHTVVNVQYGSCREKQKRG